MKFKILSMKIVGDNIQVAVSHKDCVREVFGLPVQLYDEGKHIEEIKSLIRKREKAKKKNRKLDDSIVGSEIDTED